MTDHIRRWSRWLLDNLENEFDAAQADGLPIDAGAIGIAHIVHGAQFAHHAAGFPRGAVAEYLRSLADSIESNEPWLPALVWLEERRKGDAVGRA